MKKVFLSALVIVGFIVYALHARFDDENEVAVVTKPRTIVPTNTSQVSPSPVTTSGVNEPPPSTPTPVSPYKDGTYIGDVADAFYGNIQVQITINSGRITTIQFLQFPNDRRTSIEINQQADPMLAQEAIQTQSAHVDTISGATDSSRAFIESMQSALNQAKS